MRGKQRRSSSLGQLCLVALLPLVAAGCTLPERVSTQRPVQATEPPKPKPSVVTARRTSPSSAETRDPAVIAEVQSILGALGFDAGAADGIAGPRTRRAVNQFQSNAGISRNGEVSEALLSLLRQEADRRRNVGRKAKASGGPKGVPPLHRVGTRFAYSDGRVFTIESADGDYLLWRSNRGEEISSYRNFILPPLAWADGQSRGMRSFDLDPATLWPLRKGSEISFSARHLVNKAAAPDKRVVVAEEWRCRVGEATQVSVVAGEFETIEIRCARQTDDGAPNLTRVWYYAPLIEHYVRVNEIYDAVEQDRHVELIAIHPPRDEWPPAAQAGLNWALQHALESGKPGEEFPWRSSAIDTSVLISAQKPYERGDGKNCRNFLQTWTTPLSSKNYPGTACRAGSGAWYIPGLEGALDTAKR